MAENKLQRQEDVQIKESVLSSKPKNELLKEFGGIKALKGFLPDAVDINELEETEREHLASDITTWLEILNEERESISEYADLCEEKKGKTQELMEKNLKRVVKKIQNLETAYRSLDSFFKNAKTKKIPNLCLVNVKKYDENGEETTELTDSTSYSYKEIDKLIGSAFNGFSLKHNFSLMALPGYVFKNKKGEMSKQVRDIWADLAYKYKLLLFTDTKNCQDYDSLKKHAENYKGSNAELQNVIVTCNWLIGRTAEPMAGETKPLYSSPAAALVGMRYALKDISQACAGEKFGTIREITGNNFYMLKPEFSSLWDDNLIPSVFSEGQTMFLGDTNLYDGENTIMSQYPVVQTFDWVKKTLMHFVHKIAFEKWDKYNSPSELKDKITHFLNQYRSVLFVDFHLGDVEQDPETKAVKIDITIDPFEGVKNFIIKVSADEQGNISCKED